MSKKILLTIFYLTIFVLVLNINLEIFSFGTHAHAASWITKNLVENGSSEPWIFNLWRFCLNLINIILVFVLLFLGFVNILHINYDTYQIKKYLLPLIISVVLANFSLFICRAIMELAGALSMTFFNESQYEQIVKDIYNGLRLGVSDTTIGWMEKIGSVPLVGGVITVGQLIIWLIIGMIVSIIISAACIVLAGVLYVRVYVIYLLAAVSPLAYIFMVLPNTQGLFQKWWSWFLKFVFMGPIIALCVKVAAVIGQDQSQSIMGSIAQIIAIVALLVVSFMVPWLMGMSQVAKFTAPLTNYAKKKGEQFAKENKTIQGFKARMDSGSKFREERAQQEYQKQLAKGKTEEEVKGWTGLGKYWGSGKQAIQDAERQEKKAQFAKKYEGKMSDPKQQEQLFSEQGLKNNKWDQDQLEQAIQMADLDQRSIDNINAYADKKGYNVGGALDKKITKQAEENIVKGKAIDNLHNPKGDNAKMAEYINENVDRLKTKAPEQYIKSLENNLDTIASAKMQKYNDPQAIGAFDKAEAAKSSMSKNAQTKLTNIKKVNDYIGYTGAAIATTNPSLSSTDMEKYQNAIARTVGTPIQMQKIDVVAKKAAVQQMVDSGKAIRASGWKSSTGDDFNPYNDNHINEYFSTSNSHISSSGIDTAEIDKLKNTYKQNRDQITSFDSSILNQINTP